MTLPRRAAEAMMVCAIVESEKMEIKISNDHKEKGKSFEAKFDLQVSQWFGFVDTTGIGYGKNEAEAKSNLLIVIDELIKKLKEFDESEADGE